MNWWEWLIYGAPWWLQAAGGAGLLIGAFVLLVRIFGLKTALQVGVPAAAVFAALVYGRRERQAGWNDAHAKGDRDADEAVDRANAARYDAARRNADASRLRDDDGHRRD